MFSWRWVSRLVFFVEPRDDDDVRAFAAMCRVLVLRVAREPEMLMTVVEDGSRVLDAQVVHRIGKVLETGFCILEAKAASKTNVQENHQLDHDRMETDNADLSGITELITFLLEEMPHSQQEILHTLSGILSDRLLRKGILGQLAVTIHRVVGDGVQSIDGSVIERISLSLVAMASNRIPEGLESALGAFKLLAVPSLRSASPKIAAQTPTLLVHSLPFLNQLLNSEGKMAKPMKQQVKGPEFQHLCIGIFLNLLECPGCFAASDNSQMPPSRLAALVARLMSWVIVQNLESVQLNDTDMDDDEDSDSENAFTFSSEFNSCLVKLQDHTGKLFLLSLTKALFSDEHMVDSQGLSAFCELLHFVSRMTADGGHLHGILLTFALSGNLVEMLWHQCIQNKWNVRSSAFPDNQLLDDIVAPLAVLCRVYSAFLSTAGEHEVRQKQIPLTLKDIYDAENPDSGLITVLKKCLWQVAWTRHPAASAARNLRTAMVDDFPVICGRLLGQLYDNCVRWDLAPADHFHVQTAHLVRFVDEALSGAVRFGKEGGDRTEHHRTSVILAHAPCLIPFHDRARIFQAHIQMDRVQQQSSPHHGVPPSTHAKIRRDHLLEDGFEHFKHLTGVAVRQRLRVEFIDEHGMLEAGVDGGGLFKDFLEELVKTGFDPQYGFFAQTEQRELYPNPSAEIMQPEARDIIAFLGRMLGKAVYDGILVEMPLAHFFLKKFQNQLCDLHDLPSLDPDVYTNLIKLRSQENVEDMGLHFTITDNVTGTHAEVELKPNGRQIGVTRDNVIEYIHRFADYRLNKEVRRVSSAFLQGFFDVIDAEWVQMFNANELKMLISGSVQGLDMENLRKNVNYTGGYNDQHPVIKHLWEVLNEFSIPEQRLFLKFVTGCSRAPLLGFEHMHPKICIQMAGTDWDENTTERLPTSATCANLLKLPPYGSKEIMQQKLLYAVSDKSGFYLS